MFDAPAVLVEICPGSSQAYKASQLGSLYEAAYNLLSQIVQIPI